MTVYIVQDQQQVDVGEGRLRPKFDFTPAQQYGELEFLLRPGATPFNLPPAIRDLHNGLRHFTKDDHILLTGNPVLIGLASAIAAKKTGGHVRFLQWSGSRRCYISILADNIY